MSGPAVGNYKMLYKQQLYSSEYVLLGTKLIYSVIFGLRSLIMFGSEASPTFLTPNSSLLTLFKIYSDKPETMWYII